MKISENITYVTEREAEVIENSALEKDAADRMTRKALQLAGLKKKTPRLRIVWVCAAVTALLACGVFAAETTGLDYRLAGQRRLTGAALMLHLKTCAVRMMKC